MSMSPMVMAGLSLLALFISIFCANLFLELSVKKSNIILKSLFATLYWFSAICAVFSCIVLLYSLSLIGG